MNTSTAWIARLASPGLAEVTLALLVVLLLVAAAIDVRTYRIPNWLTYGGAAIGLGLNTAIAWSSLSAAWAVDGFLAAAGGLAAGLVLLLPFYALRLMGAGDVKLMAMVGAYLGFPQVLPAIVSALIAGGAVAVIYALQRKALGRAIRNVAAIAQWMSYAVLAGLRPAADVQLRPSVGKLPYGVSICLGTLAWMSLKFTGTV